jgi:hypothetical protein
LDAPIDTRNFGKVRAKLKRALEALFKDPEVYSCRTKFMNNYLQQL